MIDNSIKYLVLIYINMCYLKVWGTKSYILPTDKLPLASYEDKLYYSYNSYLWKIKENGEIM